VQLESIFENSIYSRKGYSVAWIKANLLVEEECIILFGGKLEKARNFKVL
jgi:hypothetical protein